MLRAFYFTVIILLNIYSIHASLPYSVPNLHARRIFRREALAIASSLPISPPIQSEASKLPQGTAAYNSSASDLRPWVSNVPTPVTSSVHSLNETLPRTTISTPKTFISPSVNSTETVASRVQVTSATAQVSSDFAVSSPPFSNSSTGLATKSPTASSPGSFQPTKSELKETSLQSPLSNSPTILSTAAIVSKQPIEASPLVVTATVTVSGGVTSILIFTTMSSQTPFAMSSMKPGCSPQSSSSPIIGTGPITLPPAHNIEVVIAGVAYILPSQNEAPIDVTLADGTVARLFPEKVKIGGQTLNVPAGLTSSQPISVGGQTITAQPGASEPPSQNRDDGDQGGIFAAMGGIVGGAAVAAGSVKTVGQGTLSFANGVSGAASGLSGSLLGAIGSLSKVVSSLNGVQASFPGQGLSQDGVKVFYDAQSLGRRVLNSMKSLQNTLPGFDKLPTQTRQSVKDNARNLAQQGGLFDQAQAAMQALQEFPWEESQIPTKTPNPTATAKPTQLSSLQTTQTDTTTSASSSTRIGSLTTTSTSKVSSLGSPTPTPTQEVEEQYCIITKTGTPVDVFKSFVDELDGGKGELFIFKTMRQQMYLTDLNATQAEEISTTKEFIDIVTYGTGPEGAEEEMHRATNWVDPKDIPTPILFNKTATLTTKADIPLEPRPVVVPRAVTTPQYSDLWYRKMISAPERDRNSAGFDPSHDPPYATDDTGGGGTTIYVLDDGFDLSIPDLQPGGRRVSSFLIPNIAMKMHGVTMDRFLPADIGRGRHGTMMATLADGKLHGIAANADLHLVKIKTHYRRVDGAIGLTSLQMSALEFAFAHLMDHIQERKASNANSRSVINMSWGMERRVLTNLDDMKKQAKFDEFITWCKAEGVTVVVSAGNRRLGGINVVTDSLPQALAPRDNMIIVGAVDATGQVWTGPAGSYSGTAQDPGPRLIDVFAPGDNIEVPTVGNILSDDASGTSHAAALTSGLVAYYYSLNWRDGSPYHQPGVGSIVMKTLIKEHAWVRTNAAQLPEWDPPKVIYNLARGDTAHPNRCLGRRANLGRRQNADDIACSLSSKFLTSIRSSSASSTSSESSSTTSSPASSSPSLSPSTPTPSIITTSNPPPRSTPTPVIANPSAIDAFASMIGQAAYLAASMASASSASAAAATRNTPIPPKPTPPPSEMSNGPLLALPPASTSSRKWCNPPSGNPGYVWCD